MPENVEEREPTLPQSDAKVDRRVSTPSSKVKEIATTTASVVTFVCTVVIAIGTVVLCCLAIK